MAVKKAEAMKVKAVAINKNQPSQFFVLINKKENAVLHAPNNWKTKRGAEGWAKKHGFSIDQPKQVAKKASVTKVPAKKK